MPKLIPRPRAAKTTFELRAWTASIVVNDNSTIALTIPRGVHVKTLTLEGDFVSRERRGTQLTVDPGMKLLVAGGPDSSPFGAWLVVESCDGAAWRASETVRCTCRVESVTGGPIAPPVFIYGVKRPRKAKQLAVAMRAKEAA